MEIILIICTLLGGFAALWYFYEKTKTSKWKPFQPKQKKEKSCQHSDIDLNYPKIVTQFVKKLEGFRLPSIDDLIFDWKIHFSPETLFPFFCEGKFTGNLLTEYVFFILSIYSSNYKIVALINYNNKDYQFVQLEENEGSPYNRYISTVNPGEYKISRVVYKRGGSKILKLKNQGIDMGTFESSNCIHYWDVKKDKFRFKWITD